jgi:hypothetical protein
MQTKLSLNMLPARMPPLRNLPEMVRLGEVPDFPAELVDAAGVTKAAFNAGFPSPDCFLRAPRGTGDSG